MKKILSVALALVLCAALAFTGCNEFSGNYDTELTAEELETKLASASLDDVGSETAQTEGASGYKMKFEYKMKVGGVAGDKEENMEMKGDGEAKYTLGDAGLAMQTRMKNSTKMSGSSSDYNMEARYVEGVLYTKLSAKENGSSYESKTKAEMPEYNFSVDDTEAITFDMRDLIAMVETGGAVAYVEASDANKIKIVIKAETLLDEFFSDILAMTGDAVQTDIQKCSAEVYIRLNDAGSLTGYRGEVNFKAALGAKDVPVTGDINVNLEMRVFTEITEFDGSISAPSDAGSYADETL